MHKTESQSSSFFEQSTKVFKKTRTVVIWVPILCLIIGFSLSGFVHKFLNEKNLESEKAEAFRKAKEVTNQLDLLLANSTLRVQSYEETLGAAPLNYEKQEVFYIRQAMPYTVFQRISVFKDYPATGNSQKKREMRQIFRVTLPNSKLPDVPFDYLQTQDLYVTLMEMQARGSYIKSVLYEKNAEARLSVIIRSKSQENIYFIFTTPFTALFDQVDLEPIENLIFQNKDQTIRWKVTSENTGKDKKIKLAVKPVDDQESSDEKYRISILDGMTQSGLPLDLSFTFTKKTAQFLSAGNIAFGMGMLITIIISFLFYVLISQNRSANKMLIDKSLALEKTAHDLQEVLDEKTKFLGKVSHEIRTPLNLVLGMIDLCEENDTEKKMTTYLRSMKSSGDHLLSMIDDLIDLAKVESRDLHFQGKKINLNQFLGDVLKLIGQECQKKNLRLYAILSPSLPSVVVSDPNRLRQVLLNLLRNAIKYTNQGHIIFEAAVLPASIANKVKINFSIQDTGVGIPSDKIGKIFDAFFQIESSAAFAEGGVGLGLSIVNDIVKRMDGKVRVKSATSTGSIFEVELDLEAPESESWLQYFKSTDGKKTNIAVVSADHLFRQSFESLAHHPDINLHVLTPQQFKAFTHGAANLETYFLVLDGKMEKSSIDHEVLKFSYKRIILFGSSKEDLGIESEAILAMLNNYPPLVSALLVTIGFSSRTRDRKDLKPLSYFKEPEKSAEVSPKKELSLLVADDDLGNIELYKAYFAKLDWNVRYCYNGLEAWERYMEAKPQVLILDLRMPVMDGFQSIEKIREYESSKSLANVPIILVTADLLEYTSTTVKKFANVELLTKPVRKSQLITAIEKLI